MLVTTKCASTCRQGTVPTNLTSRDTWTSPVARELHNQQRCVAKQEELPALGKVGPLSRRNSTPALRTHAPAARCHHIKGVPASMHADLQGEAPACLWGSQRRYLSRTKECSLANPTGVNSNSDTITAVQAPFHTTQDSKSDTITMAHAPSIPHRTCVSAQ